MFDFIGDIHGHADELEELLKKLDYNRVGGVYRHSERKVFFVGDYVDRGPKIRETLRIVRSMVDNGSALAVMGNHEYNAICYNIPAGNGVFLRKHCDKNTGQHKATLEQFVSHRAEYEDYLQWFRTLPLFYEAENFRVVHACWDIAHISTITAKLKDNEQKKALSDNFFFEATDKTRQFHDVIEETLKGKESRLPEDGFIIDKDGHKRQEIRTRWWLNPESQTWQDFSFHKYAELPEGLVKQPKNLSYYPENEMPVFFGHYWCEGLPRVFRNNICCLDYSVAKQGRLVAYRFNGEKRLNNDNFVFVDAFSCAR
jgi:hypothetical protein